MRLGAYELLDQIGAGGMGAVYRASTADGRVVAVKVMKAPGSPDSLVRFERERRLLETLGKDAGFVPLLDAGTTERGPFIVMPFLAGGTLRDRLARGPMLAVTAIPLAIDLARALGRAHAKGIVHRDLKPENVLFEATGRPYIADLGLAKHFCRDTPGASQSIALSRQGELRGTAGYMAPEQFGDVEIGPAADVFATGCVLQECLTGRPAFDADTLVALYDRVRRGSPAPLPSSVPRWVRSVLARALAGDPRRRFPDGEALALALERGPASGLRRALALAASAVVVAALGLVVATRKPTVAPSGGGAVAPVPSAAVGPVVSAPAARPDWFLALPAARRPSWPLPPGLRIGDARGEYVNEKDGSVLVFVPGGTFVMGSDDPDAAEVEVPLHDVELSPYFIGKYELTNARFARFIEATKHRTAADWATPRPFLRAEPDFPVVMVSWHDATAYCQWAGLALPSEAQWECAAGWEFQGRKHRRYPWGETIPSATSPPLGNFSNVSLRGAGSDAPEIFEGYDDGIAWLAPVGSFPAGVSPVGAHDMAGNAAEWCQDSFTLDFYTLAKGRDPVNRSTIQENKVLRGGSYCQRPSGIRTAARDYPTADYVSDYTGFRVARGLSR